MKEEYSKPVVEVLGELHDVTSALSLGLNGDFFGVFGDDEDSSSA